MGDYLASRAVNQYRTRDIFTYLSLRYFLTSEYAKSDSFITKAVVQLVRGYNAPAYNQVLFYKEKDDAGRINHRLMHMPGAAESLAEAALLDHCASRGLSPNRESCFSYWLADEKSKSGFFVPYLIGLRHRQKAIQKLLSSQPDASVKCVDIKQFYPSITENVATSAWQSACTEAKVSADFAELGLHLIKKHKLEKDQGFLLTGPTFSHFLANLVLRDVDEQSKRMPASVFRYVDDFSIVGRKEDIDATIARLAEALGHLGLTLHGDDSPKTMEISAAEWLESADDFEEGPISASWLRLVGNVKKLLILEREDANDLSAAFFEHGLRLPISNYAVAIKEASAFERVRQMGLWTWLLGKSRGVTAATVISDALTLRHVIERQVETLIVRREFSSEYGRKRFVTKLRYRISRLLYVGDERRFAEFLTHSQAWPELESHFALMRVVMTGECDEVASMGVNVVQSAAQLLRAKLETALFSGSIDGALLSSALAVLRANGVPIRSLGPVPSSDILAIAGEAVDIEAMESLRGFVQEFACLHGAGESRNAATVLSAFDLAQGVTFDAVSLDYGYSL